MPEPHKEPNELGCGTQMMRWLLILINFIFILASIAGMVMSIIVTKDKDSSYLRFCHPCTKFGYFSIAVFAGLLLFSLVGFCALWKRQNCLLVIYVLFLIVFFLAVLAVLVMILMVHTGKFDPELRGAWNSQVTEDEIGICEFQVTSGCTGWDVPCLYPEGINGTSTQSNITKCPDCKHYSKEDKKKLESVPMCHAKLKGDIDRNFNAVIGVTCGLLFVILCSCIVSCKVRVNAKKEEEEGIYERF